MNVMYTNRANLQHTINVQQRLFKQQLGDRFTLFGRTICPPPPPLPTHRRRDPENNICDKKKDVRSSPPVVGSLNGTSYVVQPELNGNGSPTKEGYTQYSLNGGTYQSGNTFTVGMGTYTITVKDANNCTASTSVTISQPTALCHDRLSSRRRTYRL